jgi:hypothetical protein
VWTIFRAEVVHFKTQHIAYRKTGAEWEILGELGGRLHHKEEAKEAFQRCLDTPRYSAKPWVKLMETYSEEGDLQRTLQTAIRVAAYQYAEYAEMTVRFTSYFNYPGQHAESREPTVPDTDRQGIVQARSGARAPKNLLLIAEYGPTGSDLEDHGELLALRAVVQSGRL